MTPDEKDERIEVFRFKEGNFQKVWRQNFWQRVDQLRVPALLKMSADAADFETAFGWQIARDLAKNSDVLPEVQSFWQNLFLPLHLSNHLETKKNLKITILIFLKKTVTSDQSWQLALKLFISIQQVSRGALNKIV